MSELPYLTEYVSVLRAVPWFVDEGDMRSGARSNRGSLEAGAVVPLEQTASRPQEQAPVREEAAEVAAATDPEAKADMKEEVKTDKDKHTGEKPVQKEEEASTAPLPEKV